MLRNEDIMLNMLHLIGFQMEADSSILVADSLYTSESGLFYQQGHPLITLENLKSVAPKFENEYYTYAAYDEEKEYVTGEKCSITTAEVVKSYKALVDVSDVTPGTPAAAGKWELYSNFSNWLEQKIATSTIKAIQAFFTEKMSTSSAKSLLDNFVLYDGTGRLTDLSQKSNSFVGFEITQVRSRNATLKINKIGLQTTKPCVLNIYIMHSSQEEPIRVIQFTKAKANSLEWLVTNDLYLPCFNSVSDGGSYYICYDQNELAEDNNSIFKSVDWSTGPCITCSRTNSAAWKTMSKFVQLTPFKVQANDTMKMWDIAGNRYTYTDNYGLNIDLSIMCDFTDFFITHKYQFENLILKQFTIDMFKEFIYNPSVRVNRNSMIGSKADLMLELEGDNTGFGKAPSGLMYEYKKAMKALKIDMSGIDRVCMPCKNNGVKYGTI